MKPNWLLRWLASRANFILVHYSYGTELCKRGTQMIEVASLLEKQPGNNEYHIGRCDGQAWIFNKVSQELVNKKMPGIYTHTTVRKDKSDSYPDLRLLDLLNRLAKKHNL